MNDNNVAKEIIQGNSITVDEKTKYTYRGVRFIEIKKYKKRLIFVRKIYMNHKIGYIAECYVQNPFSMEDSPDDYFESHEVPAKKTEYSNLIKQYENKILDDTPLFIEVRDRAIKKYIAVNYLNDFFDDYFFDFRPDKVKEKAEQLVKSELYDCDVYKKRKKPSTKKEKNGDGFTEHPFLIP